MNISVPKKGNRALALVLLLVAVIIVLIATVVPVWLVNYNYSAEIDDVGNKLAVYSRVVNQSTSLDAEYKQLQKVKGTDQRYLTGQSPALAAAELQRIVKRVIPSSTSEILSTQIVTTDKKEESNKIALKIRMRTRLDVWMNIMYQLETSKPYLFIDDLVVRTRPVRLRKSRSAEINETVNELDIEFQVYGFIRNDNDPG